MSDVPELELCDGIYPCPVCDSEEAARDRAEGIASHRLWRHMPLKRRSEPVEVPLGLCQLGHTHDYMCDPSICLHCDSREMCFDCRERHCAECGEGRLKTDFCNAVAAARVRAARALESAFVLKETG